MELILNDAIDAAAERRGALHRLVLSGKLLFGSRRTVAESGAVLRTTAALNLRAKPSAPAKIVRVIPRDAAVWDLTGARNGYAKVAYNGTTGWAYAAFLAESAPIQ